MSINVLSDVSDFEPSVDSAEVDRPVIEQGMLRQAGVLPNNAIIQAAKDPELARVLEHDGDLPGCRSNASSTVRVPRKIFGE